MEESASIRNSNERGVDAERSKLFDFTTEQTRKAITRIAESGCPALIIGESGVGKRSLAAQIHANSSRRSQAFVEVCSTDASRREIEAALRGGGTIYLREVGDLSLNLQELVIDTYFRTKLAQNATLLCGATRELVEDVRRKRIREDFYYRISSVTIRIMPLRYRKNEILTIADELLTLYSRSFDRPKPELRDEIVGFLLGHNWPGNLTELQTAIKTFVAIGDPSISLAALKAAPLASRANLRGKPLSLKEAARAASIQIERELISDVLSITGGNRKRAADELGISYKALLYKLKQFGEGSMSAFSRNGAKL